MAVTDHDMTQGLEEAGEAASRVGIELVKGVELSLDWRGSAMHMLVLLARRPDLLHARLAGKQGSAVPVGELADVEDPGRF